MVPLVFILITFALLGGFFALSNYEARCGMRVFAVQRDALDRSITRIEFILQHVDLGAFLRDETRHLVAHMSHFVAHFSLQAVRAVERFLTRLVRHLRSRHTEADTAPRENVREFVKTLSDFKGSLKSVHPEISDIQ